MQAPPAARGLLPVGKPRRTPVPARRRVLGSRKRGAGPDPTHPSGCGARPEVCRVPAGSGRLGSPGSGRSSCGGHGAAAQPKRAVLGQWPMGGGEGSPGARHPKAPAHCGRATTPTRGIPARGRGVPPGEGVSRAPRGGRGPPPAPPLLLGRRWGMGGGERIPSLPQAPSPPPSVRPGLGPSGAASGGSPHPPTTQSRGRAGLSNRLSPLRPHPRGAHSHPAHSSVWWVPGGGGGGGKGG